MGGAAVIGTGGRNGAGGSGIGGATSTVKATGGATGTGGASGGGAGGSAVGGRGGAGSSTGGASAGGTGASREGFYKELFMDVGVGLDHQTTLPAADRNGWEWEFVATDDVNVQHSYMWGDPNDDNGVLLYPDREPRFMLIWTGGGYGDHAAPVGAQGIKNVQDFFNNGGSYSGSCNGNYMAWNWAYKLWPGKINVDTYEGLVDGTIPDDSPILNYFDFGGDHLITGLSHYKGGYEIDPLPAGTEVLLIGKTHANAIALGDFAFASRATQRDSSAGASKTLSVAAPESGTWYVGVECATNVTATKTSHGYDYSGNLAVLNGVKYAIKASWTE
jgi:hypothetical protein